MRTSVARRPTRGGRWRVATLLVALPAALMVLPACGQKGPLVPAAAKPAAPAAAPAAPGASSPTR